MYTIEIPNSEHTRKSNRWETLQVNRNHADENILFVMIEASLDY